MKVSLKWIKKYVDLPEDLTPKQIAYDLTLRTVEVEDVENVKDKFNNIVVGKILEVKAHPNADKLKICIVDIGEAEPVQIVCGGSNLYEGEYVVVSKPGALVVWHGAGEPVKIEKTKMRGESSYGMICGAEEVYLSDFFPPKSETEIVDLKGIDCKPGDNIADIVCMDDTVFEIDNKSLTNRPDLWGHYGIARELSVIYDAPLKELPKYEIESSLPKYKVEIKDPEKCRRYIGVEIENISIKESPIWLKANLINAGMRPINLIVDITNYVMLATGQPSHAFDRTHVEGEQIIVRNANQGEKLLLLDDQEVELTENDLVICDSKEPMCLAGIKGGKKDSILDTTTGILLEIANFSAPTIRQSEKLFDEKTDSSIRYEKNIDTERVDLGLSMALTMIKEMFEDSKIVAYGELYPVKTERAVIDISQDFLNIRLGKVLEKDIVEKILKKLGYDIEYKSGIYHVTAPVWRSTGDVSLKDDVMGDIARILSYQSFEAKPLPVKFEHAVNQPKVLLERRLKEYLAFRCGFNEIYTYPWVDIKYINAARIDITNSVRLATPPSPEQVNLRTSLIPGLLETISKNLRYYNSFKLFEMAQVFEKGEYHESSDDETLPIHKKYLSGCIVDKDPKKIFFELKGVIENINTYCHMENITLEQMDKPSWADINAYLSIKLDNEEIGTMGLVSVSTMNDSKIKRTNVAIFELDVDKLIPLASRTNNYESIPVLPMVEKDLSVIVDNNVSWSEISSILENKVKNLEFIEEYKGEQIKDGKKSITFRFKIGNDDTTLNSEQINEEMNKVIKLLNKKCGAYLREE